MSTTPAPDRFVIVAAIDTSASAEHVLRETARLAKANPGIELHLVHALEPMPVPAAAIGGFGPIAIPSAPHLMKEATEYLERQTSFLTNLSGAHVTPHLPVGRPWHLVVQLATDLDADLLVVGTHDAKGWERLVLGSIAEVIARSAPCPVLIARDKRAHRMNVPAIQPPCPDCLATQKASLGKRLWCERHSQHHPRAHTYSEAPEAFAVGSMTFRG